MIGKIAFSTEGKNIYVTVKDSKIVEHKIVESESLFSKISYFNSDNSDMTEEEYNKFYDENIELVELLADLEVLF